MPLAGRQDGDHRSCPDSTCATYTRRDTRRGCDPKVNTNRVSNCSGTAEEAS